jgi:hypothetical protein
MKLCQYCLHGHMWSCLATALLTNVVIFSSTLLVSAGSILQAVSNETQSNNGTALLFDITQSIDFSFFDFDGTTVTIKSTGDHFVMVSLQVGFQDTNRQCSRWKSYTADYWIVEDGTPVAFSNVRVTAKPKQTSRIALQKLFKGLSNGVKLQIFGNGTCSQSVAIAPDSASVEPFIPSAVLSIFKV